MLAVRPLLDTEHLDTLPAEAPLKEKSVESHADILLDPKTEQTASKTPFDPSYLHDDFNINQDARAYTIGTVQAVDEAIRLIGAERFAELARPGSERRDTDTWWADPATRVEAVARKIVDFYDKQAGVAPPDNPEPTVNQAQKPTLETYLAASGTVFATEFSAKRKLGALGLADTHEVSKVDGGFVVQPKAQGETAAAEETKPAAAAAPAA
jgi:hypothetical protein